MKLVGSRSSGLVDEFSDHDYELESEADLATVRSVLAGFILWKCYRKGRLAILTGVDEQGRLHDYSGPAEFSWPVSTDSEIDQMVAEFWVLSFKHLKALYRRQLLLLDIGLEMSCALARDLFVAGFAGTTDYKNFHNYRALKVDAFPGLQGLFDVTGMPCRTRSERILKLRAFNGFVDRIGHGRYPTVHQVWIARSAFVTD